MTGTIRTSLDQTLRMYGNSYPMPEWIIPIGLFLFFTYHFGATDQTGNLALLLIAGTTLPVLLPTLCFRTLSLVARKHQ